MFATFDGVDVAGRRVLVREDLNVPLLNGDVADATRIEAALPTLRDLAERGARVIVTSHLGRPKGKPDPAFSLRPVAARLQQLLGRPVAFADDCVGPPAQAVVDALVAWCSTAPEAAMDGWEKVFAFFGAHLGE